MTSRDSCHHHDARAAGTCHSHSASYMRGLLQKMQAAFCGARKAVPTDIGFSYGIVSVCCTWQESGAIHHEHEAHPRLERVRGRDPPLDPCPGSCGHPRYILGWLGLRCRHTLDAQTCTMPCILTNNLTPCWPGQLGIILGFSLI